MLPKEIGELSRLKELHIQSNRLTVLPPELGLIPLRVIGIIGCVTQGVQKVLQLMYEKECHLCELQLILYHRKVRAFVALFCQTVCALKIQEAQLPLRNRASAMHFFVGKLLSIAVMTYSYVFRLQNLLLLLPSGILL